MGLASQGRPKEITSATSRLSDDLLLYIFSICDARTIGNLRQCCKEFHDLSHSQIVWLEVLKTTCAALSLPAPSLHHDERSSSDIEHHATAWVRFQRVLRNAREDRLPPYKSVRSFETTRRVLALQQTPDGRFLFVVDTDGIQVWNLQTASPVLAGSLAIEIPEGGGCSMTVENESENTFIMPLLIENDSEKLSQWLAFRVRCPRYADGEVQFDLLSQFNRRLFPAKSWSGWSMHPPLPMLITTFQHSTKGRYYLAWNVVEGTCAVWAADAKDVNVQTSLIIFRDFIVNIHRASQEMIVYALPELPPKDSYAPEICAELSNPALKHIPAATSTMDRELVSPLFWKTSFNGGNVASDLESRGSICEIGNGSRLLELITLERTSTPSTFAPLPLKLERSILLPIQDPGSFPVSTSIRAYTCPDRSLILDGLSKDQTQIGFHISAPKEGSDGIELGRGVLYDSNNDFELNNTKWDLCPFAGRLCVAIPGEVEVVDFVESLYL
ncbi:hypothetical protein DL96DRAFT_119156 [Flagelloscypha sp. PMI_526]|nr:hypothetical protein DL96DRAFT_119156 [Flagelloscypha sp. PMI_526]